MVSNVSPAALQLSLVATAWSYKLGAKNVDKEHLLLSYLETSNDFSLLLRERYPTVDTLLEKFKLTLPQNAGSEAPVFFSQKLKRIWKFAQELQTKSDHRCLCTGHLSIALLTIEADWCEHTLQLDPDYCKTIIGNALKSALELTSYECDQIDVTSIQVRDALRIMAKKHPASNIELLLNQ